MPDKGAPDSLHEFALRTATEDDLDDITEIHRDGFVEEPQVNYCYPWRDRYPEDYWKWTRKEYLGYLEQPQKFLVRVVEATSESDGKVVVKPAGVSVWNLVVLTKAKNEDLGLSERRDTNEKHCEAFIKKSVRRFETYFAGFAEKQINLSALVVHPNFRRRGVGTMLVDWGIKAAEEKGWPVTLCASPMGQLLYQHLKFEQIATEVVRVEGEDEIPMSAVMVYKE